MNCICSRVACRIAVSALLLLASPAWAQKAGETAEDNQAKQGAANAQSDDEPAPPDNAIVREMIVVNHGDGTATAEFVLEQVGATLNLGKRVEVADVLPTTIVEPPRREIAAAPVQPNAAAVSAREALRIVPADLKDAAFSGRLAGLVAQVVTVSYSGTGKIETVTGVLQQLGDPKDPVSTISVTPVGKKAVVIARDRIIAITSAKADDNHALRILAGSARRLRYRRSVEPWSMNYRLDVFPGHFMLLFASTPLATSNSPLLGSNLFIFRPAAIIAAPPNFRATAVLTNPTPHRLVDATIVVRQGAFRYEFHHVNIPAGAKSTIAFVHQGSYELPIRARIPAELVFDIADGDGPAKRVVELENDLSRGIDLIGGQLTVYRDGQFLHAGELKDLFHARHFGEPVQPLSRSFQLHPSQRTFAFESVSRVNVKQELKGNRPKSLLRTTLALEKSYEIKVTNSGTTAHRLIVLLPKKLKTTTPPTITDIPGSPAGTSIKTTPITIEVDDSENEDVRFLSIKQLTDFGGAAKVRDVADALRRLAGYKQQLEDNQDERKKLTFQLEQSIIRADALNRTNDGSLAAASRLDKEQQRMNRLEQQLQANARDAGVIRSERAIFLAEVEAK